MLWSLRTRMLVVTLLAAVGMVGAIWGLLHLAATTTQQRIARGHETVAAEVDRLAQLFERAPTPETRRRGRRDFGALRSGFLTDALGDENGPAPFGPVVIASRSEVARAAKAGGGVVVRDAATADGAPIVIGALALPSGGYVWAATFAGTPVAQQPLRALILALAILSVLLVAASLHTLRA